MARDNSIKNHFHLKFSPEKNLDKKYKEKSVIKDSARYITETIIVLVIVFCAPGTLIYL